ncbi:Hypothetical predicted protein [Cloeon dipterum]|uniref:Cytochrome P450 n=1 Tax=Cloeon dipterum TaxID=197152 RepID=A0A8S1C2R8_9INSE|nr:Hypothetical predicted protein [Cloeon dipterum]
MLHTNVRSKNELHYFSATTNMELLSVLSFVLRAIVFLVLPVAFFVLKTKKDPRIKKELEKFGGPASYPLIGTSYVLIGKDSVALFKLLFRDNCKNYGNIFRVWNLNSAKLVINSAKYAEKILHGMEHHAKSINYDVLDSWMGQGLLTSNDRKWQMHRKILTPAFHFNILHEFLHIINKNSNTLVGKLQTYSDLCQPVDLFEPLSLCALVIVCESSMGTSKNALQHHDSPYVKEVRELNELVMQRYFSPFLRVDFFYKFSSVKRRTELAVKMNDDFIEKIIQERRNYLKSVKIEEKVGEGVGKRKNMAFIDTLLKVQEEDESLMTDKDIRDQVSTFMFAGHDTVTTASCWVLFILGTYPEFQNKVMDELHQVFGSSGRAPTMNDLAEFKFLERCIKETLRLYPSVPFFERHLREDVHFHDGRIAPAGVTASFNVFAIHRNPENYPDPERFNPDRFLPENSAGRHPYSYIPFSAGPRNCIGQKFAMLEIKVVVSTILRHFEVVPEHSIDEAIMEVAMVLRPQNGLTVRLRDRGADNKLKLRMDLNSVNL